MTSRIVFTVVLWCAVAAAAAPVDVRAQGATATADTQAAMPAAAPTGPPVETLYADAVAKEAAVQKALAASSRSRAMLKAVRTVVSDFETVVRRYPTSGFCDDALWRAARVSTDAFERFGEPRDQAAAVRLLQALISQYPASRLARQAPARLAALAAEPRRRSESGVPVASAPSAPAPSSRATAAPPASRRESTDAPSAVSTETAATGATTPRPATTGNGASQTGPAGASPTTLATIKGIRRSVLADSVRVIIELDAEVPFHDERLWNPSRVFVDLQSTRANSALIDQTIRFETDADVVRQIRVGRHPNQTTRIVLDADGVTSYSVYPLYSPYRLVIDCLRVPSPASARTAQASSSPAPAPTIPSASRPPATAPDQVAGAALSQPAVPARPALTPQVAPAVPPVTQPAIQASSAAAAASVPVPTTPAAVSTNSRPAWARPVSSLPVLTARRLPEWSRLPPAQMPLTSLVLPELTVPGPAEPKQTAAAVKLPTTRVGGQAEPAPTPATTVPPSSNLKGGFSIARQLGLGVSRIVIDPGHGGYDSGASGVGLSEAELVLDIALRLEKLLAKAPGVEVVLTRRTDRYVPLQERTAIANRESADLFLSIHANANTNPQVRGIETYFLNFATNLSAASVAARENATSGQAMGTLPDVVKTITLNNKLDESRDFATYVQRSVIDKLKPANATLRDLGVKQAPFVVLIGAAMPSVLAEISFLTNPQEAKLLKGQAYRQKIADALFEAVRKYQASLKTIPKIADQQ